MLPERDVSLLAGLIARSAPAEHVHAVAHRVRMRLNPHPAGRWLLNIPQLADEPLPGVQHKYRETVLVFPKQGQTCHAYCSYCFRWAQFVDEPDLKMATSTTERVVAYLRQHTEVSNVLITGGDPMIMSAEVLRRYVEPLLGPELSHIQTIRIGSKALAYWCRTTCSSSGTPGRRAASRCRWLAGMRSSGMPTAACPAWPGRSAARPCPRPRARSRSTAWPRSPVRRYSCCT